ncbi:MAG: peptidoglycan-binding protein [Bryobacteraceae bacterium]|nr:peptidoglycan-binding protein [Bryobacteraceae bacterium]
MAINPDEYGLSARHARLREIANGGRPMQRGMPEPLDAVRLVQTALVQIGYAMPKSKMPNGLMDGRFGYETEGAVRSFQTRQFPTQKQFWSGKVDMATLLGLQSLLLGNVVNLGSYVWLPMRGPIILKQQKDVPTSQDLENTPQTRPAATIARAKVTLTEHGQLTEDYCKKRIEQTISKGGSLATDNAKYFFSNRLSPSSGHVRTLSSDWTALVKKDSSFTGNHTDLTIAIEETINKMALAAGSSPATMDINRLADGPNQPQPLKNFATNISFSFTQNIFRYILGDTLAFGIGDIQGITVTMTSFQGKPDGDYEYKLTYELFDHFGADDGDLYDPAQACLWLLQRHMIPNQDKIAFQPYRLRVVVPDMVEKGSVELRFAAGVR